MAENCRNIHNGTPPPPRLRLFILGEAENPCKNLPVIPSTKSYGQRHRDWTATLTKNDDFFCLHHTLSNPWNQAPWNQRPTAGEEELVRNRPASFIHASMVPPVHQDRRYHNQLVYGKIGRCCLLCIDRRIISQLRQLQRWIYFHKRSGQKKIKAE